MLTFVVRTYFARIYNPRQPLALEAAIFFSSENWEIFQFQHARAYEDTIIIRIRPLKLFWRSSEPVFYSYFEVVGQLCFFLLSHDSDRFAMGEIKQRTTNCSNLLQGFERWPGAGRLGSSENI